MHSPPKCLFLFGRLISVKNRLWKKHTCSIFSKTGKWNPKLSKEIRLEIERHWQPVIQQYDRMQAEIVSQELLQRQSDKEKYYVLSMFPYPSGNLHLGHVRVYTISDVMARYQHACGKMVIHPMGWDAFGLPAENAAIERKIHAKDWTYSNIKKMKKQLQNMGFSFDWKREVATCDPSYYKWTQYIFLKMFEKGLAFQKKGLVNWDPVDLTVLADEQIDDNGCSWRSGAQVEKKYLKQWYLKSTVFSESLQDGLNEVDPDLWQDIILMQRNWISDLRGHQIQFDIKEENDEETFSSDIYTEHLDLIYGVTHLFVSPAHHLAVDNSLTQEGDILPALAIHPFTKEELKLVVTEEKHFPSGQDIMLGIPAISEYARSTAESLGIVSKTVLDFNEGVLMNSGEFSGLTHDEALSRIVEKSLALGVGGARISARLNDWLISRQRYWGTPIPIINCPKCKAVPVDYEDLPVTLPDLVRIVYKGGKSPLAESQEWISVNCPKCGGPAERETDTMDTFVDSTWYFLRYLDPHNNQVPFDVESAKKFMPVDLYVGGKEHAVLHLFYARFVCHFLHSIGALEHREPFVNLLTQGMIKAQTYQVKSSGKYLPADAIDLSGKYPIEKETGEEVVFEWNKMSKSKHNGVNPEDVVEEFGIDSTRLCILSNVSPQSDRNWSDIVYKGVFNWQGRIWTLVSEFRRLNEESKSNRDSLHGFEDHDYGMWEEKITETRNHIINHVNFAFDKTFHINSAISRLHSFVTWLKQAPPEIITSSQGYERALGDLVVMVGPMAPHFASELWDGLSSVARYNSHQWDLSVLDQSWPKLDQDFLMPVSYTVNQVAVSEVGVALKEFNQLDVEQAMKLIKADPVFQQKFADMEVSKIDFKHYENHKATLILTIPEYDDGLEGESAAQRNKKRKKMGKKKKTLHNMDM